MNRWKPRTNTPLVVGWNYHTTLRCDKRGTALKIELPTNVPRRPLWLDCRLAAGAAFASRGCALNKRHHIVPTFEYYIINWCAFVADYQANRINIVLGKFHTPQAFGRAVFVCCLRERTRQVQRMTVRASYAVMLCVCVFVCSTANRRVPTYEHSDTVEHVKGASSQSIQAEKNYPRCRRMVAVDGFPDLW